MRFNMRAVLAFLLLLSTLCGVFNGCGIVDPDGELKEVIQGEEEEGGGLGKATEPFTLEYVSNGDGTCKVNVTMYSLYREKFELVIPDNSPDGDLVVEVDFLQSFEHVLNAFPVVMSKSGFDFLLKKMANELEEGARDKRYQRLKAFYILFELNAANQPQSIINKMMTDYPFIEYTKDVYAFDEYASVREIMLISDYIDTYCGTNVKELAYGEYNAIVEILKENGISDEEIEGYFCDYSKYVECCTSLYLTKLSLPKGIKKLHAEDLEMLALRNPADMGDKDQYDEDVNYVIVPKGAGEDVVLPLAGSMLSAVYLLDTEVFDYLCEYDEYEGKYRYENVYVYYDGTNHDDRYPNYWMYDENGRPCICRLNK